jgi:hypothetical protein
MSHEIYQVAEGNNAKGGGGGRGRFEDVSLRFIVVILL